MNKSRTLSARLAMAFGSFRVVSVTGARQTGKTTLVRDFCKGRQIEYVSLEDPLARAAARSDPDGWLSGFKGPLAIDEIQHVPDLFRAIKLRVDRDRRPGQYIITGSALWLAMKSIGESLAGRVALLELWPFSHAEWVGRKPFDFGTLMEDDWPAQALQKQAAGLPSSDDWMKQAILRGGYPEPCSFRSVEQRALWFSSYLGTYLQRDVLDLVRIEHSDLYLRMIRLLAARTGQLLNLSSVARDLGLPQPTARRYADWLSITYQRFELAPYSANVGKRLVHTPKHYWSDTGMVASLLGWVTWKEVSSAGMDGALVETWVAGELKKWSSYGKQRPLYFWRSHGGGEADFIVEQNGRVIAMEVKTGGRVDARDMKGVTECRDALGRRFFRGIVLYGGDKVMPLGERLYAVPLRLLYG